MQQHSANRALRRTIGILLYALCVVFTSCRPKGVLSAREMQSVLHDMHYTEAVLQVAGYNYGHDEAVAKYYQQVLDKHGITQAQFDSSIVWYTDHPQRFDKIYPRVVKDLEAERDQWIALHDQTQTLQNSTTPAPDALSDTDSGSTRIPRKSLYDIEFELRHGAYVRYLLGSARDFPDDTLSAFCTDTFPPLLLPIGTLETDTTLRLDTVLVADSPRNIEK